MFVIALLSTLLALAYSYRMPQGGVSNRNIGSINRPLAIRAGATTDKAQQSGTESGLGWDSHQAIDSIPESLVKTIDGNESMRRKFESLCRNAQVS